MKWRLGIKWSRALKPRTQWRQNRLRLFVTSRVDRVKLVQLGRFRRLQQNRPCRSRFCRQCVRGL